VQNLAGRSWFVLHSTPFWKFN